MCAIVRQEVVSSSLQTPTLTYLDMRGCELTDKTIPIFGRALKLGCHLTILHMEKMNLSGRSLMILGNLYLFSTLWVFQYLRYIILTLILCFHGNINPCIYFTEDLFQVRHFALMRRCKNCFWQTTGWHRQTGCRCRTCWNTTEDLPCSTWGTITYRSVQSAE